MTFPIAAEEFCACHARVNDLIVERFRQSSGRSDPMRAVRSIFLILHPFLSD